MIETGKFQIELLTNQPALWRMTVPAAGRSYDVLAPEIELDGRRVVMSLGEVSEVSEPKELPTGVVAHGFAGPVVGEADLTLRAIFQVAEQSHVVRFMYIFSSGRERRMTKAEGCDRLTYLGLSLAGVPKVTEVRFGEFRDTVHSYCLSERPVGCEQFDNALTPVGPILAATDGGHSMLVAYEHGSQFPDAFLHYELSADRSVRLAAVKGNYHQGRPMGPELPYETIWFHLAGVDGDQNRLAAAYRDFLLKHQSPGTETRKPYIFYNTWNCQERDKWFNGRDYLDMMYQDRVLAEIDAAAGMGIEVFVIDTGWYVKTGDWQVDTERFTADLKVVKRRLDDHGMKLGLWFDPTAAAVSSNMAAKHRHCVQTRGGKEPAPRAIWGTEESHTMCLVSRYAEAFADELIRLARDLGVKYFKWDAIQQHGCDRAGHGHGTEENTAQERADCFAFELPRVMVRIVEKLRRHCPDAIVDFDVTEASRAFGLGFLAAGKFFLINNGPYYRNYDLPTPPPGNANMFFHPGPARTWICRTPLSFDKWLPSVLLLTHYFPDEPESSRIINLASMILGQNGLWGDLTSVSEEGVERVGRILALYKQVRDDITESSPVRSGAVAGSPEIHEKISSAGRGAICAFAGAKGTYQYVSQNKVVDRFWATDGATVEIDPQGRAMLTLTFDAAGAHIVLFGPEA